MSDAQPIDDAAAQALIKKTEAYVKARPKLSSLLVGNWISVIGPYYCALVLVDKRLKESFSEFGKKGWQPLPAFFSPSEDVKALLNVEGKDNYFDSNFTQGGYAFRVGRWGSAIIWAHRHRVNAIEGTVDFRVPFALVAGFDLIVGCDDPFLSFQSLLDRFAEVTGGADADG